MEITQGRKDLCVKDLERKYLMGKNLVGKNQSRKNRDGIGQVRKKTYDRKDQRGKDQDRKYRREGGGGKTAVKRPRGSTCHERAYVPHKQFPCPDDIRRLFLCRGNVACCLKTSNQGRDYVAQ